MADGFNLVRAFSVNRQLASLYVYFGREDVSAGSLQSAVDRYTEALSIKPRMEEVREFKSLSTDYLFHGRRCFSADSHS